MEPGTLKYNNTIIQNWEQLTNEILRDGILDKGDLVAYIATFKKEEKGSNNDTFVA